MSDFNIKVLDDTVHINASAIKLPGIVYFEDEDGAIKEIDLAAVYRLLNQSTDIYELADRAATIHRQRKSSAGKRAPEQSSL